jgi:cytochrome c553
LRGKITIVHPLNYRAKRADRLALLTALGAFVFAAGIDAQEGDAAAGQAKAVICTACHGADGNSINPIWPSLAGQHPAYIIRQLEAYNDGERADAGMQTYAAMLSEQDMHDIAAFFAAQTPAVRGADPDLAARGERIYKGGIEERGIAACIACHGPTGMGNQPAGYPRISHQHAQYLSTTLRDYQSGARRSDATLNQMMRNVAELLLDDEIEALASYMQGLN